MVLRQEINLGETIKLYRRKAGLTQELMVEKIGLSAKYIQFIENGNRKPSLKVIYKIAEVLDIDICYLFCPKKSVKK